MSYDRMQRTYNASNRFFDTVDNASTNMDTEPEQLPEKIPDAFKMITKDTYVGLSRYSPYYFINLNYFAHQGGVALIVDYLANNYTVANIVLILEIFSQIYYFLEEDYARVEILNKIKQPLQELPLRISDDEIKVSKKEDFSRLLKLLEVRVLISLSFPKTAKIAHLLGG